LGKKTKVQGKVVQKTGGKAVVAQQNRKGGFFGNEGGLEFLRQLNLARLEGIY